MSIVISVFIYIANFINTILTKHLKWPVVIFILLLCILMGANTVNPDIYAYILAYDPTREGTDYGYMLLVKLFNVLGFEYTTFRMITSILGILLIHQTVKKLINNPSPFYLLYFMYPFFIDIVQVRNFLVMAIFVYSIPFLLNNKRIDDAKYICLILIASSFQLTAIVYLPIVFLKRIKKNVFTKITLIVTIISLVIISLNKPVLGSLSNFIINTIGNYDDRILDYSVIQTNFGFLLFWFLQTMNFLLIIWAHRIYKRNNYLSYTNNELEDTKTKFMILIFWINIFAFVFLPFYVFQATFSRFMRNIIPLNIIAYIMAEQLLKRRGKRNTLFRISYISYHLLLLWIDLNWLYPNIKLINFFGDNWLIGW
ncbi:EpsG family protein [Oceanobacillus kapialis]|uniref:EpsG family protein n=1 Tax=Oceanobacillus kapialis TaxID=481353 RepID=UPI00384FE0D0